MQNLFWATIFTDQFSDLLLEKFKSFWRFRRFEKLSGGILIDEGPPKTAPD